MLIASILNRITLGVTIGSVMIGSGTCGRKKEGGEDSRKLEARAAGAAGREAAAGRYRHLSG